MKNPRYDGKPLLFLIECYVLNVIDELSVEKRRFLEDSTPRFRKVWGLEGNWQEIVRSVMHFPPTLDPMLKKEWERFQVAARQQGVVPPPVIEFSQQMADHLSGESAG